MKRVDYSEKAVGMRIERLSQLRDLCLSLSKARQVTPEKKRPEPAVAEKGRG